MDQNRILSNVGLNQKIVYPDGTPVSGKRIHFTLLPNLVLDASDRRTIFDDQASALITNGEFSITLWSNERGQKTSYYLCEIPTLNKHFKGQIADGTGLVSWGDFILSGMSLSPVDISALTIHTQDNSRHLTADENAALDGANSPTALNPLATMADVAAVYGLLKTAEGRWYQLNFVVDEYGIIQAEYTEVNTP